MDTDRRTEREIRAPSRAEAQAILAEFSALRDHVDHASDRRLQAWLAGPAPRESFVGSMRNLADYLALRDYDFRPIQPRLAALGLSSLGRCEAHVRASLDAVTAALARIAELQEAPAFPDPGAFDAGGQALARRRDRMFGPGRPGRDTRIMATLPSEAAETPDFVGDLIARGVDCVRINCAHDSPDAWRAMIAHTRRAAEAAGRPVPVSMDIGGPKVRLRGDKGLGRRMRRGDRFEVAVDPGEKAGALRRFGLSHAALLPHLVPGAQVWIDDGKLRGSVITRDADIALVEVTGVPDKGAKLKPEKGIAVPGAILDIPPLTAADFEALDTIAAEADIVAFSFVQVPADIAALVEAIDARRGERARPSILLKIESARAVRNLPDLIVAAAGAAPVGVMIARGDLAVDVGFERLSELQDEILWLCEAAHIPAVWATQVLDDLLHHGLATRAEATDAAMGQQAECVMLNKGPHLLDGVDFLSGVLARMDRHRAKKVSRLAPLRAWARPGG